MTNDQKCQVLALRLQGLGYYKISKLLSLSESTVKSYCLRNNIQKSTASENSSFQDSSITYCKNCGKVIVQTPHHRKKLFCDSTCRLSWWAKHQDQKNYKAFYSFTCPTCHKTFYSYGNKNRVFCSHTCYLKNRYKGVTSAA